MKAIISDATRRYAHNLDDLRERWKIRREPPTAQDWMPVAIFSKSLTSLEDKALLSLRQGLVEIQNSIKNQLGNAKSKAKKDGIYSDIDWFREMSSAEHSVGNHLLAVHDELSQRKRQRQQALERRFVDIAKETLPEDAFTSILRKAKGED